MLQCSSAAARGTTATTNHNNNMSYLSVLAHLCVRVCAHTTDDTAEASWPPKVGGILPGSEQDDVSEPGGVFRPGAAQPAPGGVLPHQPSLHRLRGAGQRAALQKTHRSPALPAPALARWVTVLCLSSNLWINVIFRQCFAMVNRVLPGILVWNTFSFTIR